MGQMEELDAFEAERPRLLRIATHVLRDSFEAQDVVQQAWMRLHGTTATIENLPGWLTTVTTRLCLDRLRATTPVPKQVVVPVGVLVTVLSPAAIGHIGDVRAVWIRAMIGCHGDVGGRC